MAVASSCREVSCYQATIETRVLCCYWFCARHTEETAADKAEEGAGHGRSVCPEYPGPHASCNGRYNGFRPRKGKAISKACRSWDRGLKLTLVNMESLVIACH